MTVDTLHDHAMQTMTTPDAQPIHIDALIIGAGVCGLWTLDALTRAGYTAIAIERSFAGDGQTTWSQGIIHSGLKYTLTGTLTGAAKAIRDVPEIWRRSLAGEGEPDLSAVRLRAPHCHLWQTKSIGSRLGMIGARAGLKTKPVNLDAGDRPDALRGCPGTVARLDETVICPQSLARSLVDAHRDRVLLVSEPPSFERDRPHGVRSVTIAQGEKRAKLIPRDVIITAGNGASMLREAMGLPTDKMQVRPLRMTLVRGPLPSLNGHCVDGNRTRVTVTSDALEGGHAVWQVGGEVAEAGPSMDERHSISHTRRELLACIPGVTFDGCEWSSYLAPRAEGRTANGKRPESPTVVREGNVITAWPSKLVSAPIAAQRIIAELGAASASTDSVALDGWDAPAAAPLPWERATAWIPDAEF